MNILVTGGSGLVGMGLRRGLQAAGHMVTATDITDFSRHDPNLVLAELGDYECLEELVINRNIETIVHSGGVSGPLMLRDTPRAVVRINIDSTAFFLDLARRCGLSRVLLMSSHVVYGDSAQTIIAEDDPLHPGSTYAASKVSGEALVESFSREFGLSAASLRLTRVYGPYRRANCFLRQTMIDAQAGKTTVIPCDTTFPYHFVSVEDVVGATLACLGASELSHAVYNVGSGEVLTMEQVRDIVLDIVPGARIELTEGRDPAPEVQKDFSLARIRQDTGWTPRYKLAEGLSDYYRRVREDQPALFG